MKGKAWLIAAAALAVLVAALLVFASGRRTAAPPAPAPPAEPESPRPAAPSAATAEGATAYGDAALRRWIVGGWAEASSNCQTDTGEHFNADGRYASADMQGYWDINDGQLTVRITHELSDPLAQSADVAWTAFDRPHVTRGPVIREGADRRATMVDGERVELIRCPDSRYTFTIPVRP